MSHCKGHSCTKNIPGPDVRFNDIPLEENGKCACLCPRCMISIGLDDTAPTEHYDAAADYDEMYSWRRDGFLYAKHAQRLAKRLGRPLKVLELGIGTGRIAKALLDTVSIEEYWGIDSNSNMLAQCESALEDHTSGIHLQNRSFLSLMADGLPEVDQLDLICAPFNVLQHIYSSQFAIDLFRFLATKLAPQGRFIFDAYLPCHRVLLDGYTDPYVQTEQWEGKEVAVTWGYSFNMHSGILSLKYIAKDPINQRVVRENTIEHRQWFPSELRTLAAAAGLSLDHKICTLFDPVIDPMVIDTSKSCDHFYYGQLSQVCVLSHN